MHPLKQVIGVGAAILPMAMLGVVLAVASRRRRAATLAEPAAPPASEA
jgi:hypothetical protein